MTNAAPTPEFRPVSAPFAAKARSSNLPFSARPLTPRERRRDDLYLYLSPKLGREVSLLHQGRLAMALELEFEPDVVAWVERPRLLSVGQSDIELCFWFRRKTGREGFQLFVDAKNSRTDPRSRIKTHRHARDLIDAANRAGISLEFVLEAHLLERTNRIRIWYRLLPFVQTATTLPHLASLERVTREAFSMQQKMSFLQLEQALKPHAGPDVRAVACHLIHSGFLHLDSSKLLTSHTVLSIEAT